MARIRCPGSGANVLLPGPKGSPERRGECPICRANVRVTRYGRAKPHGYGTPDAP